MSDPGDGPIPDPGLLADLSERPRTERWSLRAALVRYAQPEPERAGSVLEVVRRNVSRLRDVLAAAVPAIASIPPASPR